MIRITTIALCALTWQFAARGSVSRAESRAGPAAARANSIGMSLARLPAGEFRMGSEPEEIERLLLEMRERRVHEWYLASPPSEGPPRMVRLTMPFRIGVHEVTVAQFRRFVAASAYRTDAERDGKGGDGRVDEKWQRRPEFNWSNLGYRQHDDEPVVNVTWGDAAAFCRWLSRKEGRTYRLPTEAEWEYACRAGTTTRFFWGDDARPMDQYVRHSANSTNGPHRIGSLKPNGFGLYDTCGNVYEYCLDYYAPDAYRTSGALDPRGPGKGKSHVVRSGSWGTLGIHCRSAFRGDGESLDHRNQRDGFRVVCEEQ